MTETTQIGGTGGSKLRADAADNRARILTAARELIAERGIDVPMTAIARRAGVGAATLFRRFPDRSSLIAEAFATQLTHCESVLEEASADPDPWHGFCMFIEDLGRMQVEDRGFTEAFLSAVADRSGIDEKRMRAESAFAGLVDRAQKAGRLRPDFSPSDLLLIFLANGGLSQAPPEHAHDLSRRLIAYLLQSFEAKGVRDEQSLPRPSRMGLSEVFPST
ncbi:TetR/AcrR family transcriptional regulator [Brevibacterium marinum]|uniref:AcrR family transcriptional regulator n=1 Tax=Brevibacterium marinum TaxID=418643 RepID=A0A846S3A4_9MICO|nr:TetR/AcrR family transcriptional regulator [Brevibacterium marinum]NJC55347.1 AcrR family transcriptional regulator [Brevibacterium marinum]